MRTLILILSITIYLTAFGQDTLNTGFVNKAEAKNLIVNGKKEGKWVEFTDEYGEIVTDTTWIYYSLIIYKNGKAIGIARQYYSNGKLYVESRYRNGELNGIMKSYYENGKLEFEANYINNEPNGTANEYWQSGKLKCKHYFTMGAQNIKATCFDENGNEIK